MISVRCLLMATAVVAFCEADEAGESISNSIGETKSKAEASVASFNAALWNTVHEFGDLKAFLAIVTMQCPPDLLEDFDKELTEVSEGIRQESNGTYLFHAFKSQIHPDKTAVALVVSDKVAFEHLMKIAPYKKWMNILKKMNVDVIKVKFVGDPDFGDNIKSTMFGREESSPWTPEFWNQTSGFARGPTKQKIHGKTFVIEGVFEVPNDNLPTINVLNTAFMATQFDWDPTCFYARVCYDPTHDGDETHFTYGGVYLMGFRPWSRAVEFGEGKSETNWVATAAGYGVRLLEQNVYGSDSQKLKDKMRKLGSNLTTFWDFAYGWDRYKTDRYID